MHVDFMSALDRVNIYSKDIRSVGVSLNKAVMDSFGLSSPSDYIGRSDMDLPLPLQEEYAPVWMENDRRIMTTGMAEKLIEVCNCNGTIIYFRSYKMPLMGSHGNIIGLTGFSIPISQTALIPITKRQADCLKLLALGNSHKQIANALGLSHKTVEHYVENIKNKLNCESRVELIQQAIERGLVGFI